MTDTKHTPGPREDFGRLIESELRVDIEDARVMAHATDLLAALEQIHAIISRGGPRDSGRRLSEIFQLVMSALARAKGES